MGKKTVVQKLIDELQADVDAFKAQMDIKLELIAQLEKHETVRKAKKVAAKPVTTD